MAAWWLKPVLTASSLAALQRSLEATVRRLGFRYFIYSSRFPHLPTGGHQVCFDNCPEGWRAYSRQRGLDAAFDPLSEGAIRDVTPVLWRAAMSCRPASFSEAREFGLLTGLTHPIHGPSGEWSTISFIKDYEGIQAEREILMAAAKCQLLAAYVHKAAAHIIGHKFNSTPVTQQPQPRDWGLKQREREILALAAAGKTSAEIADVLHISERTIIFHLSNARHKLHAHNSRHAISKAIALGLINVK
jgi:DNA-binding CsgD family transcriptional regulator